MDPMSLASVPPLPVIPPADQIAPYVNIALSVFTAVVTGTATLLPVIIPFFLSRREKASDDKQQAVEADIKRAGLIAASVAADEIRTALEEATSAESESGVIITASERKTALARGIRAGLDYLKSQKLYERAVDVYGSVGNVESSIRAIVEQRLIGNIHGIVDDLVVVPAGPKPLASDSLVQPPPVPASVEVNVDGGVPASNTGSAGR